ncbi:hypothetical protein ANCDUO_13080 [Ancylostoma duodenale]|uniref:Uncharacterized protein n=1 Tax=Ancylostoma duodenale TaxID=51022 RepID=A0A0C2GI35_9BILA|nr:hypothetical protein ANCDUO_13080 [Ancylostoma duodenale]
MVGHFARRSENSWYATKTKHRTGQIGVKEPAERTPPPNGAHAKEEGETPEKHSYIGVAFRSLWSGQEVGSRERKQRETLE